jgi:hypothetical protein
MRALILGVTALATVSIAGDAFAQRSMKEMMNETKAKYPRSFAACQSSGDLARLSLVRQRI